MKWKILGVLGLLAAVAPTGTSATWTTLYAPNTDTAYVYLDDGSLYSFPTNSSKFSVQTAQSLFVQIASPPDNATLVVDQASDTLTAVYGTQGCAQSPIKIATYSASSNSWNDKASSSSNWYLDMPTVWSQPSGNLIYIYGGFCLSSGQISNSLYAYNTSSGTFSQPPNNNSPTELYAAGVNAIDPNTVLLIGGKATNGWIGMGQVAVWEFDSWTFRSVDNFNGIDSRTSPLIVPVWGADGAKTAASSVLIMGGVVDGREADPYVAMLNLSDTQGWSYINSSLNLDPSTVQGALALDTTLLTLSKAPTGDLAVSMFDIDTGKPASSAQGFDTSTSASPTPTVAAHTVTVAVSQTAKASASSTGSAKPLSTSGVAAISTILPLSALCAAGAGLFLVRRKKQNKDHVRRMNLSPAPSVSNFFNLPGQNDSWYSETTDTASINSWNEKRALYEQKMQLHATNSNHTLNGTPEVKTEAKPDEDDVDNMFQGRDVQVLVSSLRRNPLRVTNPDQESIMSLSRASSVQQPPETRQLESNEIFVHKRNLSNISDVPSTATAQRRTSSGMLSHRSVSGGTVTNDA